MSHLLHQQASDELEARASEVEAHQDIAVQRTKETGLEVESVLDRDLLDYLRTDTRYWLVILGALAGGPLFAYLMDFWVGASAWWSQWQGDGLRHGFGILWLVAVFAMALKHRFLDGIVNAKPLVESMRNIAETDPLALEGSVPVIRQFARSWG